MPIQWADHVPYSIMLCSENKKKNYNSKKKCEIESFLIDKYLVRSDRGKLSAVTISTPPCWDLKT